MKRRTLTDGTGRWFNMESAEKWETDDDRLHQQRSGETLYRTVGGHWILATWSSYSDVQTRFEMVSVDAAAKFLTINSHDTHNACTKEYAALEIK
jgi:hypothetical protein